MSRMAEFDYLLKSLPRQNLINLMFRSLDMMQQYNGRSKCECIIESMGGKMVEQDNGREIAEFPSLAEVKKATNEL